MLFYCADVSSGVESGFRRGLNGGVWKYEREGLVGGELSRTACSACLIVVGASAGRSHGGARGGTQMISN